jgi:hypothetical protein
VAPQHSGVTFPDLPWILVANVDNGRLELSRIRGGTFPACTGGIDADGGFWCGVAAPDGSLHLSEGQISWDADKIGSLHLTKKEALRGGDRLGNVLDCDVSESGSYGAVN